MGFLDALLNPFGGGGSGPSASANRSTTTATTDNSITNANDNRVVLGNGAAQVGAFGTYSTASNSNNSSRVDTTVFDSSVHDLSTHSNFEDNRDFSYTNASTSIDASQRNLSTSVTDSRNLSSSWADNSSSSYVDSSQRNLSTSVTDARSSWSSITDARNLSDASSRNYANSNNVTNIGTDGGAVAIAGFNAQLLQAVGESQGDTVRLIASMGADGIARQAAAATDLFQTGSAEAAAAWGHTVDASASLIDKLLTGAAGTSENANRLASDALAAYQPTENKNADAIKYAAMAGAALIALNLLKA